jgi:deoxyinosine 3'endonuclease (endonuclease V)
VTCCCQRKTKPNCKPTQETNHQQLFHKQHLSTALRTNRKETPVLNTMSRSNLVEAVSALELCSNDELHQIQALIAARLGSVTVNTQLTNRETVGVAKGKTSKTRKSKQKKSKHKLQTPQSMTQKSSPNKEQQPAKPIVPDLLHSSLAVFSDISGKSKDV